MTRRVLVVGATGTVGRAVVEALRARGDVPIGVARTGPGSDAYADANFIAADIGQERGAECIAQQALQMGGVDDVVISVGAFEADEAPDGAQFDRMFRVHALGPLRVVRMLGDALRASRGAVVALSDDGVRRPFARHVAYLAAKGALDSGMRAIAIELAPQVRVNVLRPGVVSDPQAAGAGRACRLAERSVLGRTGKPSEVASVVLAMLDAGWLSGQAWTVG